MRDIMEQFGSMVFNDRAMRERLPKDTYKALQRTIREGRSLDPAVANVVANAMKDWAIEKGVTHYTHWFQPMTGITAEKHDSFISPSSDGGIILEFSGKELIKGEPDASSFPSGGLRATFEARGYTAWDPTSYAFIKENTLCIPTSFGSYGGEALDKKTPLLRSMERLNKEAVRILRLLGRSDVSFVNTTVGPEQEYFLIDRAVAAKRPDIMYCGRTLFGAMPPKGQEMDDHYFGAIRPRVHAFMRELNDELWKLGVLAKTEHNEAAPAQHELAPIYTTTNIATDHNQLTMELMKKIAERHGLMCLLHEKPFAGVNGSGKHNNWAMATAAGENLLEPGDDPSTNDQFLLFLAAILQAVDLHQDLLRVSAASAGNDERLGGFEAPPTIVSVFLGDELTAILDALEKGAPYAKEEGQRLRMGVHTMPRFNRDTTDRNRTSPFAFTGNKFEFRMLGSAFSVACTNYIINTIVAEALSQFSDELESGANVQDVIRKSITKHKRIVFNGNNYSAEWVKEAEGRGLLNLRSTVDALPYFIREENIRLFEQFKILTPIEIHSRYEILMENYCKTQHIEALTMAEMIKKDILPATLGYIGRISEIAARKAQFAPGAPSAVEKELVERLSVLCERIYVLCKDLEGTVARAEECRPIEEKARSYREGTLPVMADIRVAVDEVETLVGRGDWPFPTYGDLLFSV